MNIMMNLMNRLILSCQEASKLASQAMDEPLSLKKRITLRIHLKMCVWCQRNQIQLKLMKEMATERVKESSKSTKLSNDAKARIARLLKNE